MRTAGFTLAEVIMALLILEVGVFGVLGTLLVASETVRRAERLERATARVESVLDSLARGAASGSVTERFDDVRVSWTVDAVGRVELHATDERGGSLLTVESRVPVR